MFYGTYRSTAMISALPKSPAVKILDPLRPLPVFSSGKSPLSVRRNLKNRVGTIMENKPLGSIKSFMSNGGRLSSAAMADGTGNPNRDVAAAAKVEARMPVPHSRLDDVACRLVEKEARIVV